MMNNLEEKLKRLKINHVFGMAGLMSIQPNISDLTEDEVFKATEIVDEITTKINWDIELEQTDNIKSILGKADSLSEEDADTFFDEVYKHFNIKAIKDEK